jgi:hypothetical protein
VSFRDGRLLVASPLPNGNLPERSVGEREADLDLERAAERSRRVSASGIGGSLSPTGTDSEVEIVDDHALTLPASSESLSDVST